MVNVTGHDRGHPGEFRHGWPLLLGAFLGIAVGLGSLFFYSQGIFLKPLAAEFGWSRGQASLGPFVGTLGTAVAAPFVGRMIDVVGPVRVAVLSTLLLSAGFAALGRGSEGLGSFLAITALAAVTMVGAGPLSYSRLIVAAFDRHRGLALGLALMGTGIGSGIMPVFLVPYIAASGWRAGYYLLALVVLMAVIPVAFLISRGRYVVQSASGADTLSSLIRQRRFSQLALIFFLASLSVLGTVVHFVPMLSDAGLSPARTGAIAGIVGIAVIFGRIFTGLLLDRIAASRVTAGLFFVSATGLTLLGVGGAQIAVFGALAIGLAIGAEIDLLSYLISRLFPAASYGTAYGALYGVFLLGAAIGPVLTGYLFDATGGYAAPLFLSAAMLTIAGLLALRIQSAPDPALDAAALT